VSKSNKGDGAEQIVAKAFAHPLRVQILIILNERVASPNLLSQELGQSLNLVAYHVRVLEKYECIELVDTKQRRGATEHFYKATRRQFLSDSDWSEIPESLRPGLSRAMMKSAFEDLQEAIQSGAMESEGDFHFSRTPLVVDKQGWAEATELIERTLERALEIQAESSARTAKSGERGILAKVHLLQFRSPDEKAKKDKKAEAPAQG
jgi:hypothetical protein